MGRPNFNPTGLRTLFGKEIRRFSKVWIQTVVSPLVTTSLYFLVFGIALGSRLREIDDVPYIEYVVPGLVMLAMINAAFLNTSSSLFQSKINGTITDLLVAPLGPLEILTAYVSAAALRGLLVGTLVYVVCVYFVGVRLAHPALCGMFAVSVCMTFASLGLLTAMWADKFDHLSVVPNFVLTPLTFLGGVFYSVRMLPEPWASVSHFNPIFFMVSGMRYAMLGTADLDIRTSALSVLGLMLFSLLATGHALSRGYNLRQ